jgi:hypothetical protein
MKLRWVFAWFTWFSDSRWVAPADSVLVAVAAAFRRGQASVSSPPGPGLVLAGVRHQQGRLQLAGFLQVGRAPAARLC